MATSHEKRGFYRNNVISLGLTLVQCYLDLSQLATRTDEWLLNHLHGIIEHFQSHFNDFVRHKVEPCHRSLQELLYRNDEGA